MKPLLKAYGIATVVLAAAAFVTYTQQQSVSAKGGGNTATTMVDCCSDPLPCGEPGQPPCWPPIPPPNASN